jgi:hypothetical protein
MSAMYPLKSTSVLPGAKAIALLCDPLERQVSPHPYRVVRLALAADFETDRSQVFNVTRHPRNRAGHELFKRSGPTATGVIAVTRV